MFGFFTKKIKKLKDALFKAPFALGNKIRSIFSKSRDDSSFDELEQLLYEADLGAKLASSLTEKLKKEFQSHPNISSDEVLTFLRSEISKILPESPGPKPLASSPHVIMIVGVNGSGKTTSIAKLANHYKELKKKPLLVAADTFRAAAIDQLQTWATRLNIPIVKSQPKSDPSSIVFDGLQAAKARGAEVVLIDTAGRLHTKTDLMQELEKIKRVCKKVVPDAPHETLLVLDATTGQNAIDQAKTFHEYTPIDGIVLAKLDGSAKGGITVAIQKELSIPVLWVGVGENVTDFMSFDANDFIDALLATD